MLKKITIAVLGTISLILVAVFLLLKFSKIPEPFSQNSQADSWSESGDFAVSTAEFSLHDKTRETQAHDYFGKFDGSPYRKLDVTVWFPEPKDDERFPLIVYSHGFMSKRDDVGYVLRHLSSYGYIVIAADFPLTSSSSGDALLMADVVNQPQDLTFLVNQITSPDSKPGRVFSHMVNQNKIGVIGYSLGGLTSALAAYHPDYLDKRLKAVVSLAGASAMLAREFYQTSAIPFMMVAGTSDEMTPYDDHAAIITDRVNNSVLVKIERGSHMGFAGMAAILRWNNNPDSLACALMNMKMESMGIARGTDEKAWYPLLGSAEQGIIYDDSSVACDPERTAHEALNPLRQHMLIKVSTVSFLESVFNDSAIKREEAKAFLAFGLAKENSDVSVFGEYVAGCQEPGCQ